MTLLQLTTCAASYDLSEPQLIRVSTKQKLGSRSLTIRIIRVRSPASNRGDTPEGICLPLPYFWIFWHRRDNSVSPGIATFGNSVKSTRPSSRGTCLPDAVGHATSIVGSWARRLETTAWGSWRSHNDSRRSNVLSLLSMASRGLSSLRHWRCCGSTLPDRI